MSKSKIEKIEGSELQVGYCSVCGQARQFQTSGGVKDTQLNEWATDECKCAAGAEARRIRLSQKKAVKNIENLFVKDFPAVAMILNAALPHILEESIDSITVKVGEVDAKISITSKNKVKVEKKTTRKTSLME